MLSVSVFCITKCLTNVYNTTRCDVMLCYPGPDLTFRIKAPKHFGNIQFVNAFFGLFAFPDEFDVGGPIATMGYILSLVVSTVIRVCAGGEVCY